MQLVTSYLLKYQESTQRRKLRQYGYVYQVISGAQLRAARALLGLSAAQLAEAAGVGHRTIQRFEAEDEVPDGRTATLKQLVKTLEAHGITFLGDPVCSPGVQLQRHQPKEPQDT
jgi:transcriptional regulator with XRE-family HTH domain